MNIVPQFWSGGKYDPCGLSFLKLSVSTPLIDFILFFLWAHQMENPRDLSTLQIIFCLP